QIDGLVRQESRRDVAVGKRGRGHQRGVGDAHAVVHLVAVFQATKDADGVFHRRLTGRAGSDDGVQLIDEGDDLSGRVLDVVEDGLEPFLEFAAVLGAGHHRTQVQGDDGLVAQAFGYVAGDDALGQTFHDGGLTDTGLADQHRVVFGAAAQHLYDASN